MLNTSCYLVSDNSIWYIDIAILSNIIYRAIRKTTIIIDIVALLIDIRISICVNRKSI